MKKCIEGSQAVAIVVNMCRPDVVASFPITPQTHIVENLAKMKADGVAEFEFINTDSEFASASVVLGASATGGRAYTATSSQGLLLMTEVLFSLAGLRLPAVITCANRAVSSPINIWNDQQDSLTIRDAGWIMLYASDNQMAIDLHLLAFKITQLTNLPVMVNMDGFVLTHTYEPVDLPTPAQVNKYLPKYKARPGQYLDIDNPVSLGCLVTPEHYQEIRLEHHQDLLKVKQVFKQESVLFNKIFGRNHNLINYYGPKSARKLILTFGSLCGTIKDVLDEHNKNSKDKVALLEVVCFRPFPDEELIKLTAKADSLAIIEKDISLGSQGALALEVKKALYNKSRAKIHNYSLGLGGRDITKKDLKKIISKLK